MREFFKQVRANKMALAGTIVLTIFVVVAIAGPLFVPFDVMYFGNV